MTVVEELTFTVGDRLVSLSARLLDDAGAVVPLTGQTITFRMVALDGTVKIAGAAATIVDATLGTVRYDWAANDVNAAGIYNAWFIRTSGGLTAHHPGQGKLLQVTFVAES